MRWSLLVLTTNLAFGQQIILNVGTTTIKACGQVEIDGGFVAPGLQETPPRWVWGDGETTQSFFPARHRYAQGGVFTVTVSIVRESVVLASQTVTVTATASTAPVCSEKLVVEPGRINLRDGRTSEALTVSRVSPSGVRTIIENESLIFRSLAPTLVSVGSTGLVSATGFGFGDAEVEDPSTGQRVRVNVTAGEFYLSPPYLRLHLTANPEAQLRIVASRADGQPLDLTNRSVRFLESTAAQPPTTISLSSSGLVRALRVPATFNETPLLRANIDGMDSSNTTVVRIANAFPDVSFVDLAAGRTVIHAARQIGPFNFEEILRRSRAADWTSLAFELEAEAAGYRTNRGGLQWLVNDVGGTTQASDPTVPCGASGNPTRLGISPANPQFSCFVSAGSEPFPQWFTFFHEMGHDYAGQLLRFSQWIRNAGNPLTASVVEGMASAFGQYATQTMRQRQVQYGIPESTLIEFERTSAFPDSRRWSDALQAYVAAGSQFSRLDADVFNGITGTFINEFGTDWFTRFVSVFLPVASPFDFAIETPQQASTFTVAAMSAAADRDLRERFRGWGFPIDDAFYTKTYGQLLQLSKGRNPVIARGGVVNAASFVAGSGAAPSITAAQWISVFGTSLAPRLLVGSALSPSLDGTKVEFIDSAGVARQGSLQFVSPGHINVLAPEGLASGTGQVRVQTFSGPVSVPILVESIQPGIFSAAASGRGPAAATWLQVRQSDGERTTGLTFDPNTRRNVPLDLAVGATYVSFYGTGFRAARVGTVTARIGGEEVPVLAAVAQGQFPGLDQVTVGPLPAALSGKGEVELDIAFDGRGANKVSIAVR